MRATRVHGRASSVHVRDSLEIWKNGTRDPLGQWASLVDDFLPLLVVVLAEYGVAVGAPRSFAASLCYR
jgi:hypothetical protein